MGQFYDLNNENHKVMLPWLYDDKVYVNPVSTPYSQYENIIESLKFNYPCNINMYYFGSHHKTLKKHDLFLWIVNECKSICFVKDEQYEIIARFANTPSWLDQISKYSMKSVRLYFSDETDFVHFRLKFNMISFILKEAIYEEITQLPCVSRKDFFTSNKLGLLESCWTMGPQHMNINDIRNREYMEEFDSEIAKIVYPLKQKS